MERAEQRGTQVARAAQSIRKRPALPLQANEGAFRGKVRESVMQQHCDAVS